MQETTGHILLVWLVDSGDPHQSYHMTNIFIIIVDEIILAS